MAGETYNDFFLSIRNSEARLFRGPIKSLTSNNDTGRFDILPMHANFVSLIKDFLLIRELSGKETKFDIGVGLLRFFHNKADVYIGIESSQSLVPQEASKSSK